MDQHDYWNNVATTKVFTTPFQREAFSQKLSKDAYILDVGCGYGRTLNELYKEEFNNLHGIDFSEKMIERGRTEFPNLDLNVMKSPRINLPDESVDGVILFAVLTCISKDEDQEFLIREIRRVLKPNGLLYVNDFLLNTDERNLDRYEKYAEKYGAYGVFELPEGALVRHHNEKYIHTLLSSFQKESFEKLIFTTMNGNKSNGFAYFGRKYTSTLYVSDLDGTLMRNDQTLSEKTVQIINRLVENGIAFTYATARSIQSAHQITKNLMLTLPVITRNGCVLADNDTCEILEKSIFSDEDVAFLQENLPRITHYGLVSSYEGGEMFKTYCGEDLSLGLQKYIKDHSSDHRMRKCDTSAELFQGVIGYVTMIDEREILEPIYEKLRTNPCIECVLQKDTYGEEYWLEICPENSTKAKAILKLKERLGFDKLVVFGDSVNDMSMFGIADEAYAVNNATPELKNQATAVIGSNEEDAVAEFWGDVTVSR